MKKIYILLICIVSLVASSVLIRFPETYVNEPKLSLFTCKEYWNYHKKMVDVHSKDKEENSKKYFSEVIEAWNFNVEKFKRKYSDLSHPMITVYPSVEGVEDKKGNPYFFMYFMMACEAREENMPKKLGNNLQKNFIQYSLIEKEKNKEKNKSCKKSPPKMVRILYPSENGEMPKLKKEVLLSECAHKDKSSTMSFVKDSHGVSVALSFCDQPLGKKLESQCRILKPTKENICLNKHGLCSENVYGQCGWQYTKESSECMKRPE